MGAHDNYPHMAAAWSFRREKRMTKRSWKSEIGRRNENYYKVPEKRYHQSPMSFPRKRESRNSATFWTPAGVYPVRGDGAAMTAWRGLSATYYFSIPPSAFRILSSCFSLLFPLLILILFQVVVLFLFLTYLHQQLLPHQYWEYLFLHPI